MELYFNDSGEELQEKHTTIEKNSGRIETRVCRKLTDLSWLKEHKWPGLRSVIAIGTNSGGTRVPEQGSKLLYIQLGCRSTKINENRTGALEN